MAEGSDVTYWNLIFIGAMVGGLVVMAAAIVVLERQLTPTENGVTAG